MKIARMKPEFVSKVPDKLEDGVLYVCLQYKTALHKCACGCGEEIVTPIAPNQWKVTYDGENCTLYPSIGNWQQRCKSHYWIRDGRIHWAEQWSEEKIRQAQKQQQTQKKKSGFWDWLFK